MRISDEAIYQALYFQSRGALRRELTACLRTGRALRVPRARTRARGKKFVTPEIMISQRPVEAEDRAVPSHWEGDLILGLGSSAIGTLVERSTRFTMLLHLPRMDGHGQLPTVKNGPSLAGHGAAAVRDAIAASITTLARYGRLDLLCLDEFGYVHLDPRGAELLFQVLTEREERASVAVASNAPFSEWGQTFTDPRLAAAVVDRLTFRAHIIETGAESYRLRASRTSKGGASES